VQVDRPGKGSGEPFGSPHSPPENGVLVSTDKKIAAKAACPPFHRAVKPGAALAATFFTLTRH
jgi:hypothetical protein